MTFLSRFRRRPDPQPVDPMPRMAAYSDPDVAAVVGAARPGRPVIGLAAHGRPIVAPDGHLLIVSGAGGGRSALMRAIGAQALRDGQRVVVLDIKRASQMWARRPLPGCQPVAYERDLQGIADRLVTLAQEGVANVARIDGGGTGVTVLFEEPAATLCRLTERWRSDGNSGRGTAVDAYNDLLYMGCAEGVRVVATSSGGTVRSLAGPATRECFTRVVSPRVSRNTWAAVAASAPFPTHGARIPGRFYLAASEVTPFQALLMTDAEAGDVATSGREEAR